jgi:hypothetical protein
MRGNGEGEPLLVEMTLARQYPVEFKIFKPRTVLCPKRFIYQSSWWLGGPPQKSMREWEEYPSGSF